MVTKKELQQYVVELLSECFGTFILILLNEGAIANYKFARFTSHYTLSIYLAIGVGVYTALMAVGSITGTVETEALYSSTSIIFSAHINPAVSISLMTVRKLKPLQCVFYVIGQIVGAFLGAALVYLVYWSQFNEFDGGTRQITGLHGTGDIFFTMPGKNVPHWNAFIDQIVSTGLLLIFIVAVEQDFNRMISEVNKPFALALIVMGINCAFSINAAAALNPARDLGPRLFSAFVYGWNDVFCVHNYYFWIPIVGPILGGIVGVWIYQCYASIIKNYWQFSNTKRNKSGKIGHEAIRTEDDLSELRQQQQTKFLDDDD
ncbi:unnamed protein product [Adineta steineri]|uniref:Uncharacterized protein n=1 Tax=Adineta steineri TaxID=433720 RepID=A0A819D0Y5_9BILA|nr:unnamed protein product [Adineta steineri]